MYPMEKHELFYLLNLLQNRVIIWILITLMSEEQDFPSLTAWLTLSGLVQWPNILSPGIP